MSNTFQNILWLFVVAMIGWAIFNEDKEEQEKINELKSSYETACGLRKIEWDGHLWVLLNNESICHSPDCPCLHPTNNVVDEFEEP